jgi:hypothetical protein
VFYNLRTTQHGRQLRHASQDEIGSGPFELGTLAEPAQDGRRLSAGCMAGANIDGRIPDDEAG